MQAAAAQKIPPIAILPHSAIRIPDKAISDPAPLSSVELVY